MKLHKHHSTTLPTILILSGAFFFAGCPDEGPAEEIGEDIDEGVEETEDALEDTGEKIEDTGDDMQDG